MMFLLAASLMIAEPTSADAAPTTPPAAPTTAAEPKKDKTICKAVEDSASRLGRKICRKESEWAKGDVDTRQGSSRAGISATPQN